MGELDAAQIAALGTYASRVLGPAGAAAAAFGILFIPSPENIRVEGDVPEIPGLRYSWNRDETELHLTYDDGAGGQRIFSAFLDGEVFRDQNGDIIGRVTDGNRVAIDALATIPDLVNQNEPKLCPAPAPDVAGSDQGRPYEGNLPRQYEDFLKLLVNPPPDGPTPSGFAYYLPNPADNGEPVSYDDCQKATGIVFDFKGLGYAKLINDLPGAMETYFAAQAERQLAASAGRPVVGFSPRRRPRCSFGDYLILRRASRALQSDMFRGGAQSDGADKLSLFYTGALDRSGGRKARCHWSEVFADARFSECDRSPFLRLASQQKLEDLRRRSAADAPARHRTRSHC